MAKPVKVDLPVGSHYVCMCGNSGNAPYCDGSHKGSDKSPQLVEVKEAGRVAVCACKCSATMPWCDGTHKTIA